MGVSVVNQLRESARAKVMETIRHLGTDLEAMDDITDLSPQVTVQLEKARTTLDELRRADIDAEDFPLETALTEAIAANHDLAKTLKEGGNQALQRRARGFASTSTIYTQGLHKAQKAVADYKAVRNAEVVIDIRRGIDKTSDLTGVFSEGVEPGRQYRLQVRADNSDTVVYQVTRMANALDPLKDFAIVIDPALIDDIPAVVRRIETNLGGRVNLFFVY